MRPIAPLAAAIVMLAAGASTARADFFGTVELPRSSPGPAQLDLFKFNVSTRTQATLPASVNTAANEFHPALNADGKRMAFVRQDPAAGTLRIVVVDFSTGQSADLFSGFESQSEPPLTPVFDGASVVTGRRTFPNNEGQHNAAIRTTSLANFPAGPFQHGLSAPKPDLPEPGRILHFSNTDRIAYTVDFESAPNTSYVFGSATTGFQAFPDTNHPAVSVQGKAVVFERRSGGTSTLVFRPLTALAGEPIALPAIVNAPGADVTRPAFTADGRYLAFVRRMPGSPQRLFVWDTQTQLLLDELGVGLPTQSTTAALDALAQDEGAVDIRSVPVFAKAVVIGSTLKFTTKVPSNIGILVQGIVGETEVLGRKAPRLKLVGRVPLGSFTASKKHKVKWDFRVEGDRLPAGRYLVTPRSVTAKLGIRDLGKPAVVRVPKP